MERRCNICREWDKHLYWDAPEATKFQFWHPLRSNFTEQFSIPRKFVENFKEKLDEIIHLKSPSGKTWHVELKKINGEMLFRDGWKEFVEAHLLEEHDLLVFKYDRDSHFRVSIFEKNGCEKESAYSYKQCNHKNHENSSEDSIGILHFPSPKIHICSSSEIPREDAPTEPKQHKHGRPQRGKNAGKDNQESLKWKPENVTSDTDPYPSDPGSGRKASHAKKKVKSEEDSSCSRSGKSHENTPSSNSVGSLDRNAAKRDTLAKSSYASILLSERRPVTRAEIERALERAQKYQPHNHFFLRVMMPTHVYKAFFMAVPKEFAENHLPHKRTKVTLRIPRSTRKWVVSYRQQKCSSGFGGMWRIFVIDNRLEEYDVCIFELKENNEDFVMDVHIFRVVPLAPHA